MNLLKTIAICGLGQMGWWIAKKFESASFQLILYDTEQRILNKWIETFKPNDSIQLTSQFSDLKKADLILESISEDVQVKIDFYNNLNSIFASAQIITSNTSILDPNDFLVNFKFKNRFSCFHFYFPNSVVDIMPLKETDKQIIDCLGWVAKKIGEQPIHIPQVILGYIFSNLAASLTDQALDLAIEHNLSIESIDDVWIKITGMKTGPFGMLDIVGLDTSLKIRKIRFSKDQKNIKLKKHIELLEKYVNQGHLGLKTKRGFYSY